MDCLCYGVNRDTNAPEETPSIPPKPPIPPFEARGVNDIMRVRDREGAGVQVSTSDKNGSVEVAPELSIQDKLQGQRPKALKAWMDYRVNFSRAWNQGGREPQMRPLPSTFVCFKSWPMTGLISRQQVALRRRSTIPPKKEEITLGIFAGLGFWKRVTYPPIPVVRFRRQVHIVAQAEHSKRVDEACEQRLLLDSACKQR